jgi:PAS domain S-box-containing protein
VLGKPNQQGLVLAAEFVAVAILYFLVAKGSLVFASLNPSATPIWPPTGIALALTLLRGHRILPAIFLGALAANVATAGTFASSGFIALGNTLEAFVGAYFLKRWADAGNAFLSPSGVAKFAAIVAVAGTVSATLGVTALSIAGHAAWVDFPPIWVTWWLGDVVGAIMVAPPVVLWAASLRSFRSTRVLDLEAIVLLLFATGIAAIGFGPLLPSTDARNALAFLAVLPLLWAALTRSPRDTATVALILSAFAVWGVTAGQGPFVQATLNDSFLLLVSFIASVTLPSLALSSAMSSRDQAIVRTQQDYHRLVEGVRDYAIFMLDPEGRVTTWNSGAARIKKYSKDEILGRHFSCFYSDEDQRRKEPEQALASAAELGRYETEGWRVRRDGSQFWASSVISAIRSDDGELLGFAKVIRDVTIAREAALALERTREQLHQSQKMEALGQLTGGVAHDFNNLLMVISAAVRALEKDSIEPEQLNTILREMRAALERGTDLTRQLLAFGRRDPLRSKIVDPAGRLNDMKGMLERSLRPDIKLKFSSPKDVWGIDVDPGQLDLAILNLTVNARDAMPKGGIVTIATQNVSEPGGDFVQISVIDAGVGMPSEVRLRAFEPFFSTKEPGRGTGLGLSQVHGFASQSGGSVWIESEIGKGTTVRLLLPKADESRASDTATRTDDERTARKHAATIGAGSRH